MQPDQESQSLVVQPAIHTQPLKIRFDFGRKVYSYVMIQSIVNCSVAAVFVFSRPAHIALIKHIDIFAICFLIYLLQQVLHFGLSVGVFPTCLFCPSLLRGYMWLLRTSPFNLMYLFTFAAITGVVTGHFCGMMKRTLLGGGILCIGGAILLLTTYAIKSQYDFSSHRRRLAMAAQWMLFLVSVVHCFNPMGVGVPLRRCIAGSWTAVFAAFIVLETQLIFGTARETEQKLEYTVDMYAFSAFHLFQMYFSLLVAALFIVC